MMAETTVVATMGKWLLSELASKFVDESADAIKTGIINAVKDRNADQQNMQTRFYQVIIDTLNEVTHYKYKDQDKLYDAAECIVKGLLKGQMEDDSAIRAGLKVLGLEITDQKCDFFEVTLISEISKDESDVLYKEMDMLWKAQSRRDIQSGFQNNHKGMGVLGRNQEKMMDVLDDIMEMQKHNTDRNAKNIKAVERRTKEYADKWDKNVFLNNYNERDEDAGVNVKLSQIYLKELLPSYIWKTNAYPRYDMEGLLREYVIDQKDKKMLLILGQPGIGKSTLITWLTANFKEQQDNIYVYQFATDLKNVNWQEKDILNEILKVLRLTYDELENKTIILDGFDEIGVSEGREQILNRLYQELEVTNCLKSFSLLITCRENYVSELEQLRCDYVTLQVWNDSQIQIFGKNYSSVNQCKVTQSMLDKLLQKKEIFGISLILYMVLALNITIEEDGSVVDIYDRIFSLEGGGIYDRCIKNASYGPEHPISEIKRQIHQVSQRIAFWMFEHEPEKAFITQREYESICEAVVKELPEKERNIKHDVKIGNYFKSVKHCEGVESEELQFVHRSIYEYFVAVHFFESIRCLTTKEEVAGKLGDLLKEGKLSKQILEYINCKFDQMKRNDWPDMIKDFFQIMLRDGMTYHVKEKGKSFLNIIEQERNIFTNMLELVGLWNPVLGKLDDKVIIYLQSNRSIGLNLRGIELYGADLNRADLREANLIKVKLNRADLNGANLNGADLNGSDLNGADLNRVNLSEANLSEANLFEANLSEANLIEVNLSEANLSKANLSKANLYGANLIGANLNGANLSEADLRGAGLSGADLNRANLIGANLKSAIFDEKQVNLLYEEYDLNNSKVYISSSDEIISYEEYRNRFLLE